MGHTKEPWSCNHQGWCSETEKRENQYRIVACVNACAGIPTEHLERCNAINAVDEIIKERNALTKQRDALVAALQQWKESTLKHSYPHEHIAMLLTEKALASVKGKMK